ncbi:MATE family efflux transporter [Butyrivibrio sp. INlla16]|uniref:MATE family efflux transporter n=1 Tax=Butyrivibrio sp. INlla16 TaxID=1520807 RepID=UPI00088A1266|nr:MATE family efflux transporter [Butyrivibrio sp. INlla16]SDB63866.1 putative efflux protein, MATE family [Butyrivibrio sp. INlla16]
MGTDMTKGSITKHIFRFAFPVALGILFQQLYNIVDTMIVGRLLGVNSLAGVGSTTGLWFFEFSVVCGICNGFAVSTAQSFGEGNKAEVKGFFRNGLVLGMMISLVLMMLTIMSTAWILKLTNTPNDIYNYAHDYIIVLFEGIPFTFIYNYFSASLRSIGDSRTPVIALVIASFLNMGLDVFFIMNLGMGVAGAALATVISQIVSGVFLGLYIIRKVEMFHFAITLRIDHSKSRIQLKTAIPMALQGAAISIGILIVQASVNSLGTIYVVGSTAGNKLYGIMAAPVDAICQSLIPLSSQNYGARRNDRIKEGWKKVVLYAWIFTAVLSVIAWFAGPYMIRIFIDTADKEIISYGHQFLICFVLGFGFLGIQQGTCFTLQGTGNSEFTIASGILETAGRLFGALVLTKMIGYMGICLALPLAWVFTDMYMVPVYFLCIRRMSDTKETAVSKLQPQM